MLASSHWFRGIFLFVVLTVPACLWAQPVELKLNMSPAAHISNTEHTIETETQLTVVVQAAVPNAPVYILLYADTTRSPLQQELLPFFVANSDEGLFMAFMATPPSWMAGTTFGAVAASVGVHGDLAVSEPHTIHVIAGSK